MDAITFEIPASAVPQPRARATRGGRMYSPNRNGISEFKAAVGDAATAHVRGAGWFDRDWWFEVEIECVLPRPRSHLTSKGEPRRGAPAFPGHGAGDWDNLAKGVCDAITATDAVWLDDARVISGSCRKRYAASGEAGRTIITLRRVAHAEDPFEAHR